MDIRGHLRQYFGIMISAVQVTGDGHNTTDSYADVNINGDLTIEYRPPHPELPQQRSHDVKAGSATPSQATVCNRVKPFRMMWLRERA